MTSSRVAKTALVIVALLAPLSGGGLMALTDEEIFRDFRFNFLNPGARSLGMGGAFIAAADDATAAEANPAALHYVNRYEVFAEYRVIRSDPRVFRSGGGVDKTNLPVTLPFVDLTTVTNDANDEIPTFASFAIPLGKGRTVVAFSRQVVLNVKSSLTGDDGTPTRLDFAFDGFPIWINPDGVPAQYSIENTTAGTLDAELVNYNLAFSVTFGDLSLGLTGTMSNLDMRSELKNEANDPRGILTTVNPRIDADMDGNFDDLVQTVSTIDDTDSAIAYTIGLNYHPDSLFRQDSPVRFGLVYHKGADLSVGQRIVEIDPATQLPGGTPDVFENRLHVPDRFGMGVTGSLGKKRLWQVALDLERINYSDLLKDFKANKNFFTSGQVPIVQSAQNIKFEVDDATVVHLGLEYSFATRGLWNFGFRGGYFNAPDNRIRMTDINPNTGNATTDAAIRNVYLDAFRGGEDENHFTLGFSATTPFRLQLQFAGDFGKTNDQFLMSTIYRFGKTRAR